MSTPPKSQGEKAIERIMQELDPASDRYQVLATAKRFKSSWVELGEKLLSVQQSSLYRSWGYESFEEYCLREIRIQKPTAQKLTLAYRYLEKEEPDLLARPTELKPPPDYRSVDLLRRAREESEFSEEEYADLRKAIVEEERSHPTVLKRFRETAATHHTEEIPPLVRFRSALTTARRLETALETVPELASGHLENLGDLIAFLTEQVEKGEAEA
jgi:hypothetical protein